MGYYQMKRMPTKAGRKNPRYIEVFDRLRDLEYTVGEARCYAGATVKLMDAHPDWTTEEAIREAFK